MDPNPARRANVVELLMPELPKRWWAYRFTSDSGIRYKLKIYKDYGILYWELSFKTSAGMKIRIEFDSDRRPDSIRVNGFTWKWRRQRNRNKYRWFTDAAGLSNGLPDKVATAVNSALKDVQQLVQQAVDAAQEERRRSERQEAAAAQQAYQRRSSRNREHLQEVLEKV